MRVAPSLFGSHAVSRGLREEPNRSTDPLLACGVLNSVGIESSRSLRFAIAPHHLRAHPWTDRYATRWVPATRFRECRHAGMTVADRCAASRRLSWRGGQVATRNRWIPAFARMTGTSGPGLLCVAMANREIGVPRCCRLRGFSRSAIRGQPCCIAGNSGGGRVHKRRSNPGNGGAFRAGWGRASG